MYICIYVYIYRCICMYVCMYIYVSHGRDSGLWNCCAPRRATQPRGSWWKLDGTKWSLQRWNSISQMAVTEGCWLEWDGVHWYGHLKFMWCFRAIMAIICSFPFFGKKPLVGPGFSAAPVPTEDFVKRDRARRKSNDENETAQTLGRWVLVAGRFFEDCIITLVTPQKKWNITYRWDLLCIQREGM